MKCDSCNKAEAAFVRLKDGKRLCDQCQFGESVFWNQPAGEQLKGKLSGDVFKAIVGESVTDHAVLCDGWDDNADDRPRTAHVTPIGKLKSEMAAWERGGISVAIDAIAQCADGGKLMTQIAANTFADADCPKCLGSGRRYSDFYITEVKCECVTVREGP